jgi:RNA polymerase sigma-70 factor (ECF subfamily)
LDRVEEQRLVAQAKRGDREAFAALYRAHVQAIYRYLSHRLNDRELADDLTGDVFVRAIEGLKEYTDTGRPFLAWLYRIAHARLVDHYRRTSRRPTESDVEDVPIPVEMNWDDRLLRQHAATALRDAIAQLTDEQQDVVILRFVEGHRLEAVAQLLGKNANAIKALQHRALKALETRLRRSGLDIEALLAGLSS